MEIHTYMHIHAHTCTCIHTHTHIHIETYTHIQKGIHTYHRSGSFGVKKCKAHTLMKLKHTRFFTIKILLSNNLYMHLSCIVHTHACQMYVTITYTRLKRVLCFIT